MMTVAEVDPKDKDCDVVFVDIDDSGYFYLKQDDDWIKLPISRKQALLEALAKVWM